MACELPVKSHGNIGSVGQRFARRSFSSAIFPVWHERVQPALLMAFCGLLVSMGWPFVPIASAASLSVGSSFVRYDQSTVTLPVTLTDAPDVNGFTAGVVLDLGVSDSHITAMNLSGGLFDGLNVSATSTTDLPANAVDFNVVLLTPGETVAGEGHLFNVTIDLTSFDGQTPLTVTPGTMGWLGYEISALATPEGNEVPLALQPGLITQTLTADFNADGVVNLLDLDILGSNWQDSDVTSARGDATGDGQVNLLDLDALGSQWNQSPDALTADFNGDDLVNLLDLDILGANWQALGATRSTGDANGDGTVNLLDLDALGSQWQSSAGFGAALSQFAVVHIVPEPTTLGLIGLGAFLAGRRPSRNARCTCERES